MTEEPDDEAIKVLLDQIALYPRYCLVGACFGLRRPMVASEGRAVCSSCGQGYGEIGGEIVIL